MKRMLLTGIVAVMAALPLAQTVHAEPAAPAVPGVIAVPDGHKPFLTTHAVGVQVYRCTATGSGHGWSFIAPRADLYGGNGKLVGTHFGGPTWQAKDGSRAVARRVAGVTVEPTAIDWLLLSATSTTPGSDGDRLTRTTYIQRTATTGGLAPAAALCTPATVDTQVEVPYTADYHFWKATGTG